jgi:hypothetical protein
MNIHVGEDFVSAGGRCICSTVGSDRACELLEAQNRAARLSANRGGCGRNRCDCDCGCDCDCDCGCDHCCNNGCWRGDDNDCRAFDISGGEPFCVSDTALARALSCCRCCQ